MEVLELPVEIDQAAVLSCLGYKDNRCVPLRVLAELADTVQAAAILLRPAAYYRRLPFSIEPPDRILLADGGTLTGRCLVDRFAKADHLVLAVISVGSEISECSTSHFQNGNALRGMLLDAIGSIALQSASRSLWQHLADEAKKNGLGITCGLSPGDNGWNLTDQAVLFQAIGKANPVFINDRHVMTPPKSLSVVYGVGFGIAMSRTNHDCSFCERKDCPYRKPVEYEIVVEQAGNVTSCLAKEGENLFAVLQRNGIEIRHACNGKHTCGKCQIQITGAYDEEPSETELSLLGPEPQGQRLACFITVHRNMKITLLKTGEQQIVANGPDPLKTAGLSPRVRIMSAVLKDTATEKTSDAARLLRAVHADGYAIALPVLRRLPELLAQSKDELALIVYDNKIVSIDTPDSNKPPYGIAVDIGTTTVVAYLVNLLTGAEIDAEASLNPQRAFGADVISRIEYVMRNRAGLDLLHTKILSEINRLAEILCARNSLSTGQIYEYVIVANTTMLHLFYGVNPSGMGKAPYTPVFLDGIRVKSNQLGLVSHSEGVVVSLPAVSGFVGADIIAGIIACGMHQEQDLTLLIDIGTNGEIVLGHRDRMVSCSTAAGSAFEGAKICCGVGAVAGAIDHVLLTPDIRFSTIGGAPPIGICGSGLVDVVAELVRNGLLLQNGRMLTKEEAIRRDKTKLADRLIRDGEKTAFMLVENPRIVITQKDIRELQMAKAAIAAGVSVLLRKLNADASAVKTVYLAGGFGTYLDTNNAIAIGLLPAACCDKIKAIGNAAGAGAKLVLTSQELMAAARELSTKITAIELAYDSGFSDEYMNHLELTSY